jgi:diguanylate cyclase (GGDEF)-like protein
MTADSPVPPAASTTNASPDADGGQTRSVGELARLVRRHRPSEDDIRGGRAAPHAVRDELLGLPSRRRMQEAIDAALDHLRAGGEPSAVLLIDVEAQDGARDRVLVTLAERLAASLTREDLVARFDGHVFIVVAHEIADEAAAYELAAQLKRMLEAPPAGDPEPTLQVSIGVSMMREEDPSVGAVVARADAAMWAARNKAHREAHGDVDCTPESAREALVEAAFERSTIEDFDVYYQPVADLRCGSVAAVEAILRWEHPDLGTISPMEFLPIAERQGQMVTLGRLVIEKACAQTVRWAPTRDGLPMRTTVNISPSQVADPAFLADVMAALAGSGATGHQIAFELSPETVEAVDPALLQAIVDEKIELTFDQFGTGSSTQAHLGELPITTVKLDRSFLPRDGDAETPVIVQRTAESARDLGLHAVAMGVERLDQLERVRLSGFAFAQGHLFSRPLSAPMIEQLVHRERPFGALLAPRPVWLDLALDGHEPAVEVEAGEPAYP